VANSKAVYIEEVITVSWTETRKVGIGHYPCGNCQADSPRPTSEQILDYAQGTDHGGSLWPGSGDDGSFLPPGWSYDHDLGVICTTCTKAKNDALAALKKPRVS
jgi:hypothetical protein